MLVKNDGQNEVRFAGQLIKLGERTFVCPPLSLGSVNLHKELIGKVRAMEGNALELLGESLPIIHAALVRNYPLTIEEVGELVDIANFNEVIRCVWGVSGLLPDKNESGEPRPVPETTDESKTLTSASSSASSPL